MESTSIRRRSETRDHPCIWAQAGVVARKTCHAAYDCAECRFDKAMRRTAEVNRKAARQGRPASGKRANIAPWQDRMKTLPRWKRPCIYHMKQRIAFRACHLDYRCGSCEFDQFFSDQFAVHAVVEPVDTLDVGGFKVPQGYYFHRGHTWAKLEGGGAVRVGLDDFALRLLGPPDRVESPLMGKTVEQGRADIGLSRGHLHASAVSPVSGVVTAVNPRVRERGVSPGEDPYTEGWIMTVHADDLRSDLWNLMINTETETYMAGQLERLYQVIEETAGPLAVDGGTLGDDIYGKLPDLGWDRLVKLFLVP